MTENSLSTFLFTDIEGSSSLWERATTMMERSVARQEKILTEAIEAHNGRVVKTMGDGLYAVFPNAADGVEAALDGMRSVTAESWPEQTPIHVRMGLHSGEAYERDGDYYGPPVNRAARLEAAAHGGQIVVSGPTADLATDRLPSDVQLVDIGEVRLRGMSAPERVSQIVAAGLPRDFPPLVGVTAPNNLPAPATTFFGRADEMGRVLGSLGDSRLVTLVGFGGVGKTRLSVEAATEAMKDFPDGTWFVDLSLIQSAELVAQTVASTVGVTEVPGEDLADTVASALRTRNVLVVLDNCEHVIEGAAKLSEHLLFRTDDVRVLATSRQSLGVPGEVIVDVPPLSLGNGSAVNGPAVQLFLDRARAARPGFAPSEEELAAVVEICAHLDGIPLAIELAAVRARLLRPTQIASRLDDRFALLTGGARTARPRQQTLRALVQWSYELLGEDERVLFDRLSVFSGVFTIEAVQSVCAGEGLDSADVFDLLAGLVDQSLIRLDDSETDLRFGLLETLREYGAERLEETGDRETLQGRHAEFFATQVDDMDIRLRGPDQAVSHRWLEAHEPDILQALDWLTANRPDRALEIAADLGRFWYRKGAVTMGKQVTSTALGAAGTEPTIARGRALTWLGRFVDVLGDTESAWDLTAQALEISRRLDDADGTALALNALGTTAYAAGRLRESADYLQSAIAALDQAGIPWVAAPLYNLGMVQRELGELDTASSVARRLIDLGRQNNDPWATAKGRLQAAAVALDRDRLDEADREATIAEPMFVEQGAAFHAADAIFIRLLAFELRGDVQEALRQFDKASEILVNTGGVYDTNLQLARARIALREEDATTAASVLGYLLDTNESLLQPIDIVALLHESARLAFLEGRPEAAIQLMSATRVRREAAQLSAPRYQTGEEEALEAEAIRSIGEAGLKLLREEGEAFHVSSAFELVRGLIGESALHTESRDDEWS